MIAELFALLLAQDHVVTRHAGDAVARERAVVRKRAHWIVLVRGPGNRVDCRAFELRAGAGLRLRIHRLLALAQNAVAAEASILDECFGFFVKRAGLARKL